MSLMLRELRDYLRLWRTDPWLAVVLTAYASVPIVGVGLSLVILLFATCSCAGHVPSQPTYAPVHEPPTLTRCMASVRVLFTGRDDFRDQCGVGSASDGARECLAPYRRGVLGRRTGWLVLIVDEVQDAARALEQGIAHAWAACTYARGTGTTQLHERARAPP